MPEAQAAEGRARAAMHLKAMQTRSARMTTRIKGAADRTGSVKTEEEKSSTTKSAFNVVIHQNEGAKTAQQPKIEKRNDEALRWLCH